MTFRAKNHAEHCRMPPKKVRFEGLMPQKMVAVSRSMRTTTPGEALGTRCPTRLHRGFCSTRREYQSSAYRSQQQKRSICLCDERIGYSVVLSEERIKELQTNQIGMLITIRKWICLSWKCTTSGLPMIYCGMFLKLIEQWTRGLVRLLKMIHSVKLPRTETI